MDGIVVSHYGVGFALDFTCNDRHNFGTWNVVHIGRRFVVFNWGYILSLEEDEICTCVMAFIRHRGQCMFLFRGVVWVYHRFCRITIKLWGIFYLDFICVGTNILPCVIHKMY